MSKRVLIFFAVGILAIIAGIFLMKYELTKKEPEEEEDYLDEEPEADEDSGGPSENKDTEAEVPEVTGPKAGYYYDRRKKAWLKCKPKPEPEIKAQPATYEEPAPLTVTPG